MPVQNDVSRNEDFNSTQIKDLITNLESSPQIGEFDVDVSTPPQKLKITDFEKGLLSRLNAFRYACRLDGIFIYQFRISASSDKNGASDGESPLGEGLERTVARLLSEIIKLRLKHYHDFHWDGDRHVSFLTPEPVRIADTEDECCSPEILAEVQKFDEKFPSMTEEDAEHGADTQIRTMKEQRLAKLSQILKNATYAKDIPNQPLIDLIACDRGVATLMAHRWARNRQSHDIRGPQFALLRYREGLSLTRRRCLEAVVAKKDWQRKNIGVYPISSALVLLFTGLFVLDSILHVYGLSFKVLPVSALVIFVALPLMTIFINLKENKRRRQKLKSMISSWRSAVAILAVLATGTIVTLEGALWTVIEFLTNPFTNHFWPLFEVWSDLIKLAWKYEAKSFLFIIGCLLTVRWLASSQWQHKPIMKVIRHTTGFYSHVNIYARAVNGIYGRLSESDRLAVDLNPCAGDFSDIILSLEKKYDGHYARDQREQNRYVLLVAALGALFAFLQWSGLFN